MLERESYKSDHWDQSEQGKVEWGHCAAEAEENQTMVCAHGFDFLIPTTDATWLYVMYKAM